MVGVAKGTLRAFQFSSLGLLARLRHARNRHRPEMGTDLRSGLSSGISSVGAIIYSAQIHLIYQNA